MRLVTGSLWLIAASACGARTGLGTPDVVDASDGSPTARGDTTCPSPGVIYTEDFSAAASLSPRWSTSSTTTTPATGDRFLGTFIGESVDLSLSGLPCHRGVTVEFDLYILLSWDGSQVHDLVSGATVGPCVWGVGFDGTTVFQATFSNVQDYPAGHLTYPQSYPDSYPGPDHPPRTGAASVNALGYVFNGVPMDSTYHLVLDATHAASTLTVRFGRTRLDGILDDPWGIDHVVVTLQ